MQKKHSCHCLEKGLYLDNIYRNVTLISTCHMSALHRCHRKVEISDRERASVSDYVQLAQKGLSDPWVRINCCHTKEEGPCFKALTLFL